MSKERVFELIRKEEAALFLGAGMSLYAGYPSGVKLAEVLYENLTTDLQQQITYTTDLPKLAEDIYYIKGGNKNYLIEILKKEFQKEPKTSATHHLLAKIPQIKTIITTNYDTLIETSNKTLEVIRKSIDCPIANPRKQWLFKIHGDLSDTANMILTRSDYNKYFVKNSESSIFWNTVKSKLVENHIIFIGYALEDNNVVIMIEKILQELGENHKEMFFVAPSIAPAKLKFLQQKGIEYIQSTGEELVKEIVEDLNHNYIPGLTKGIGTADTALVFANNNKISLDLSKLEDNFIINNVTSLDGNGKNEIKLRIEGEEESTRKIIDSLQGKDLEDVHLDGELLKDFSHYFNGIRISSRENIKSLHLLKTPSFSGAYDFEFEDGFELQNYNLEIFIINPNDQESKINVKASDFEILITLWFSKNSENTKVHVEVKPSLKISSAKNGINFYNILSRIASNQKFKISKEDKLLYNYRANINFDKDALDANILVRYFKNLKKIENHFNVKFSDINLQDADEDIVKHIVAYIDKIVLQNEFNGLTFKNNNKEEFDHITKNEENSSVLIISEGVKTNYTLHGINLTIGYLHKFITDAYIENLEEVKKYPNKKISLKSRSSTLYFQFTDSKTMITEK